MINDDRDPNRPIETTQYFKPQEDEYKIKSREEQPPAPEKKDNEKTPVPKTTTPKIEIAESASYKLFGKRVVFDPNKKGK